MTDAAIIAADFVDFRTVKTRKVLQIVLEVDMLKAQDVLNALGFPTSDKPISVAVALLSSRSGTKVSQQHLITANVPVREQTEAERAIKMAHVYASNPEYDCSIDEIHFACGVESCAEFKTNPSALQRFLDWEKDLKANL